MMEQKIPQSEMPQSDPTPPASPDDCGTIYLDGVVRIFDPNSGETIVETRT